VKKFTYRAVAPLATVGNVPDIFGLLLKLLANEVKQVLEPLLFPLSPLKLTNASVFHIDL
jgi:hypothetical protein